MAHEFYIIETADPNFEELISMSTSFDNQKPKCSLDETKAVIQLKDNQEPTPILDPYPPISKEDAIELTRTEEWQEPEP